MLSNQSINQIIEEEKEKNSYARTRTNGSGGGGDDTIRHVIDSMNF